MSEGSLAGFELSPRFPSRRPCPSFFEKSLMDFPAEGLVPKEESESFLSDSPDYNGKNVVIGSIKTSKQNERKNEMK